MSKIINLYGEQWIAAFSTEDYTQIFTHVSNSDICVRWSLSMNDTTVSVLCDDYCYSINGYPAHIRVQGKISILEFNNYDSLNILYAEWGRYDDIHRLDGPALIANDRYNGGRVYEWWINGNHVTTEIHAWAEEMGISLGKMSDEDIAMVRLYWENYQPT